MREGQSLFGLQIAKDNEPDTQCCSAKLIELIEIRRLIQVRDHDARVIVVRSQSCTCCAPAHGEVRPESRTVELLNELPTMLEVRIDQQCARIVCGERPRLHGSTDQQLIDVHQK